MHVGVDQAGHQHAAVQVDDAGPLADQGLGAGICADIHDPPGAHGQCLLHAVPRIDGMDVAVAVDQVGGRGGCMRCRSGQQQHGKDAGPAHAKRLRTSRSTSRAALCPGAPVTPPPGWVPAPQVYRPGIGPR